jgi:hypothetical protein
MTMNSQTDKYPKRGGVRHYADIFFELSMKYSRSTAVTTELAI